MFYEMQKYNHLNLQSSIYNVFKSTVWWFLFEHIWGYKLSLNVTLH